MRRAISATVAAAVVATGVLLGTAPSWASDTYSSCGSKGHDGKSFKFSGHGWGDFDDWKGKDFEDWKHFGDWGDWFDGDYKVDKKHKDGKDCWVVHHKD